jgi:hypothetical protein
MIFEAAAYATLLVAVVTLADLADRFRRRK